MPAVAGQKRDGVEDDEPLDALGVALGPQQADRAPVVDDEPDAVDAGEVEEALDEGVVAGHREVAVAALARAAEAGQVGRQAAGAAQEGHPVVRARRARRGGRGRAASRPAGGSASRQKTGWPSTVAVARWAPAPARPYLHGPCVTVRPGAARP